MKDHPEDQRSFELHHTTPGAAGYPVTLIAHKDQIKQYWLKEIREYASDVVALAEHAADDLQLSEVPEDRKDDLTSEPVKVDPPKVEPIRNIEEALSTEKRKEVIETNQESESKKAKVEDEDMAGRYSSSRYSSASSRVVEGNYNNSYYILSLIVVSVSALTVLLTQYLVTLFDLNEAQTPLVSSFSVLIGSKNKFRGPLISSVLTVGYEFLYWLTT